MIRISILSLATLIAGTTLFSSCASMVPPFSPGFDSQRGLKAREFRGTPKVVRPAVIKSLRELGYEVMLDGQDETYLTAIRGMGDSENGGLRQWTRLGVEIRWVDRHRRAPRTLVEIDGEMVQGSFDGPIEASFPTSSTTNTAGGKVKTAFYQRFFDTVSRNVEANRPQMIYGLRPPE